MRSTTPVQKTGQPAISAPTPSHSTMFTLVICVPGSRCRHIGRADAALMQSTPISPTFTTTRHATRWVLAVYATSAPLSMKRKLIALGTAQVLSSLSGYNASIIAYGQTGTGKTYTMEGEPSPKLRGKLIHVLGTMPSSVFHAWRTPRLTRRKRQASSRGRPRRFLALLRTQ